MLRPYERSFNSGQMLRKLSPLNSTFDKSHYSLLSRAHIEAVSTFPTSTPLPPPPPFLLFLLTPSFPSLFFVLPFHQHAAVNFTKVPSTSDSTKDVHTRHPTKLKSDQSLQIDVSIFKRENGEDWLERYSARYLHAVSSLKRLCILNGELCEGMGLWKFTEICKKATKHRTFDLKSSQLLHRVWRFSYDWKFIDLRVSNARLEGFYKSRIVERNNFIFFLFKE